MNQARTDKRKRLRETKRLGTVLTNGFVELAKLFGSVAPPDRPPELFGMMEAIAECLSFFPMIVAAAMTARGSETRAPSTARRRGRNR